MGGVSIWHWIIVGIVVMLLFGRGKVSELMGDVAKGIKAFKKGMSDDETTTVDASRPVETTRSIEDQRAAAAAGVQSTAGERKAS
jgi:sec-independent protein translocase protein TatA